jgi:hypothetical protein
VSLYGEATEQQLHGNGLTPVWGAMQEAVFTVHCEAYAHYELGRFKSRVTLKIEVICPCDIALCNYKFQKDLQYDRSDNVKLMEANAIEQRLSALMLD